MEFNRRISTSPRPCNGQISTKNRPRVLNGFANIVNMLQRREICSRSCQPFRMIRNYELFRHTRLQIARNTMSTSTGVGSGFIFYPLCPTSAQWIKVACCAPGAVALEGTLAAQKVGPQIGRYDIYVDETRYMFCMSLPGVDTNSATFSCEAQQFGEITAEGHVTAGLTSEHESLSILVKALPDPGPFAVTFILPGRVKAETLAIYSSNDGLLWGVVNKQQGELVAENIY